MNTNDNGRAEARSRANRRLRNMTIGTALLGVAATGTLGWVAAAAGDGSGASIAATTALVTTSTTSGTSTAGVATATSAPVVTSSSGGAHVSTSGS